METTEVVAMRSVPTLPKPCDYEREYDYWPWGDLLKETVRWLKANLPNSANVCDYMCGTGFLLKEILKVRPDLHLVGCSLDASYITYGKEKYLGINLEVADALDWNPPFEPSAVICTGGLHHLDREQQPRFIAKVASELAKGSVLLLGEELIGAYHNESDRRLAVFNLSSRLIRHLIVGESPNEVIEAAANVFTNDLFERGEYKTSYDSMVSMLESHFTIESVSHFWPTDDVTIGDFLFVCRKQ